MTLGTDSFYTILSAKALRMRVQILHNHVFSVNSVGSSEAGVRLPFSLRQNTICLSQSPQRTQRKINVLSVPETSRDKQNTFSPSGY